MAATPSQLSALKDLLAHTTRGVVMTRRRDGGVQSSPMALLSGTGNGAGDVLFATRATTAKIKNLARDPYTAVCIITDKFVGPWMHVEGQADITYLPDALPELVNFYARRGTLGDTTTEQFAQRMRDEQRCLVRVRVTRIVQP